MKALFCHDHYYYRDGDITLSRGQYDASVWDRYLNHFEDLTVIGRDGGQADRHEKGINQSSRDRVSFKFFPNISSLKNKIFGNKNIQKSIAELVAVHDVIILRGTSELGALAFSEAKRQGKFVAMEVVSCAFDELWFYGSLKAKLYAPYRFFKQRQLVKKSDAVIYVSQDFLQKPGDPEPFQKIIDEKGLSNRVFLDGIRQSGEGVWQWLRDMDLYVQPSFQEGVPRATIEAMAQGLPVIGSNAGGIPELIDDKWIVPRGNANALADKIKLMVSDIETMKSQGTQNFKTAQNYEHEKLSMVRNDFWGSVANFKT